MKPRNSDKWNSKPQHRETARHIKAHQGAEGPLGRPRSASGALVALGFSPALQRLLLVLSAWRGCRQFKTWPFVGVLAASSCSCSTRAWPTSNCRNDDKTAHEQPHLRYSFNHDIGISSIVRGLIHHGRRIGHIFVTFITLRKGNGIGEGRPRPPRPGGATGRWPCAGGAGRCLSAASPPENA